MNYFDVPRPLSATPLSWPTTTSLVDGHYSTFTQKESKDVSAISAEIGVRDLEGMQGLRQEIGPELFDRLSDEKRRFILRTSGSIKLGFAITHEDVAAAIKNYDEL